MAWLGFRMCLCRMLSRPSSLVLIIITGKSRIWNCFYTMSNESLNSIYVNLAVIMFSIYYFSEVEEYNRVIEKQLRKEGRASRW